MSDVEVSEDVGLRARKKLATRVALTEAARALFDTKGFEGVTVDEIADAAGVSRRTFFRYFATKESVAFPRREARRAAFLELVNAGDSGGYARVRAALLTMSKEFMANREENLAEQTIVGKSPALIAHNREIDQDWMVIIAQALAEGSTDPDKVHEARVIAAAVMGVIRATLDQWYADGAEGDLEAMGRRALDLLERGIT